MTPDEIQHRRIRDMKITQEEDTLNITENYFSLIIGKE